MNITKRTCPDCNGKKEMLEIYGSQDFEQQKITCPYCNGKGEQLVVEVDGKTHLLVDEKQFRSLNNNAYDFSCLVPISDS